MDFPFGKLPAHKDFPVNIRKHYIWLYLPVLSWLCLVFPLVFIPIPVFVLGPIGIALFPSTTRRKSISFFRRSYARVGRRPPSANSTAMFRWTDDAFINLFDIATLGLSNLFVAAGLLKEMIDKEGSEEERAEPDPVGWLLKWLLIGNIPFIAAYILCPGLIFEQILYRLERHLYLHYEPLRSTIPVGDREVLCRSITSWQELQALSQRRPVLLYTTVVAPEDEPAALEKFIGLAGSLAPDPVDENTLVGWCNCQRDAPSHYRNLARHLKAARVGQRAWSYFVEGELVATREVALDQIADTQRVANLARQTLGVPQAVEVLEGRVDTPDVVVRSLRTVEDRSQESPVLVVVFSASDSQEAATIVEIREKLIPKIRPALEDQGAALVLANAGRQDDTLVREQLTRYDLGGQGFIYLKDREVAALKKYGFLWTWDEYARDINAALGHEVPSQLPTVQLRYWVVKTVEEALHLSERRPVLLITRTHYDAAKALAEFSKAVLPDVCSSAEKQGAIICWYEGQPKDARVAKNGVTLVKDGVVSSAVEVGPAVGDALRHSEAIRSVLSSL